MSDGNGQVRFAIRLPQTYCFADPPSLLVVAEAADELGFWGVTVQDHLIADKVVSFCGHSHSDDGDDRVVYEALHTLAFVGARTERVKLISGVLITPFRHAVLLAKEIASLDVFTDGRVVVGTGVGAPVRGKVSDDGGQNLTGHALIARREFDAMGIRGHRGKLADESLQVMAAIWADGAAEFHGEYYDFVDLAVYPKPAQRPRPPLWIGGRSEHARRRVLTYADAWFPSQISAGLYAEGVAWMRDHAGENDLKMPEDYGVNIFAAIDSDGDKARVANEATFGHRFSPEWLSQVTIAGNPDEFVAQIRAFADAGVNVVDLKLIPPTLDETLEQMKLVAEEVMPAFAG